jgi:phosphoglycerate kinase
MSLAFKRMENLDLNGKRVLIRQDLNVPIKDGKVSSDARILASLPTIKKALELGASVIIMSHLGRPTEGGSDSDNAAYSLAPVADHMSTLLKQKITLVRDYLGQDITINAGDIAMLENVRFNTGEKSDDSVLSQQYAALADIYVMDAFGTAHRAQASTHGVAKFAKQACAGPLLAGELDALEQALAEPARPMVAIVGGSKVSTKLTVLESLSDIADQIIVGGGIANTFLAASGKNVGKSLYEADLVSKAQALMQKTHIPIPTDVVCGKEFSENAEASLKQSDCVNDEDMIFDIGPTSSAELSEIIKDAKTILWNGPVGVFEFDQFGQGTKSLSLAIADSAGFSIAGGGDTLAAVDKYNISEKVSYISTGGGAFLEYVEGKELPAVAMLKSRFND